MVFVFTHMDLDHGGHFGLMLRDWTLPEFKRLTFENQRLTLAENDAWATNYLECVLRRSDRARLIRVCRNHDQGRSVPRFGSDKPEFRVPSARMLAIYLLTLSGTSFIYQGQEIGMINAEKDWDLSEYKDCHAVQYIADIKEASKERPEIWQKGLKGLQLCGRDHARTYVELVSDLSFAHNSILGLCNGARKHRQASRLVRRSLG